MTFALVQHKHSRGNRISYPHENDDCFVVLKQTVEGFTNTVTIKNQAVADIRDAEIV